MQNNIINFSDINLNLSNLSFKEIITQIKLLDTNNYDKFIKWKDIDNQLVLQTQNYFYKFYNIYKTQQFFANIRIQLTKIYRQIYNLDWQIMTVQDNNIIYQILKKQKLKPITEKDMSLEEMLLNWKKTLLILQNNILLPNICKQLQQYEELNDIYQLKLVRECILKYADYGLTKNGNVILLDDTDWIIAMINKNKQWLKKQFNIYKILTKWGERVFAPINIDWNNIKHFSEYSRDQRWILYNIQPFLYQQVQKLSFNSKRYDQIGYTIKLLSD